MPKTERKLSQFQFLIGRLGTADFDIKTLTEDGFQFLIGRLGTDLFHK